MHIDRLFQVLVVGGTLLAASTFATENSTDPQKTEDTVINKCEPAFCNQPGSCVPDPCTGKPKVKEGFECCWGTSCDESN